MCLNLLHLSKISELLVPWSVFLHCSGAFLTSIPRNEFIYVKSLNKSCLVGQENKYSDVRYMLTS